MSWTTADLLLAIKNTQMIPDASTGSLSPAVLLQFATEVLQLQLTKLILSVREKYYETYTDTAYSTSTPSIAIPNRSIGGTLSAVQFLYGTDATPLEPMDPNTIATTQGSVRPTNFYFENNKVVFYPPPNSTYGTVRMRWYQRPNRLEQIANCAQITAFNSGTGVATCVPPSAWTTSNTFDFIPQIASQATPYNLGSAITAISSTTMTFTLTAAQAALVTVGDWIALAEFTPIPEIPFEFQTVLAQMSARRAIGATNDQIGLANTKMFIDESIEAARDIISPRDQTGNKKVVSNWRRF